MFEGSSGSVFLVCCIIVRVLVGCVNMLSGTQSGEVSGICCLLVMVFAAR